MLIELVQNVAQIIQISHESDHLFRFMDKHSAECLSYMYVNSCTASHEKQFH